MFLNAAVIVAALGYFVDVYDLILFSVVRVTSLRDLGVPEDQLLSTGVLLLNAQMIGMLTGGIMWGIWGDKKGRISVLFGSILMYSLANFLNGWVHSIPIYALLRFIAGVGLAGELGAGITLVCEVLPKEKRGLGTTIVATVGVMGAVVAALVGDLFHWRTAYFVGGALGLSLLLLRISVRESGMYNKIQMQTTTPRGNFLFLFKNAARFRKYFYCILTGLPIWFVLGVLVTFAPEIGKALGIAEPVKAGAAVLYSYIGLVAGDLCSGLLSQRLKSRKRAMGLFLGITAVFCVVLLFFIRETSPQIFYYSCLPLGFGIGYWAVFITSAAEQFGTNLRATVTTSVPNLVRGAAVPMTLAFAAMKPALGVVISAFTVGLLVVALAALALMNLKETFGKDLDFEE